jgi:hypothetical protein
VNPSNGFLMAGPFLNPVDLDKYPDYIKVVVKPMDLSTMKRQVRRYMYYM